MEATSSAPRSSCPPRPPSRRLTGGTLGQLRATPMAAFPRGSSGGGVCCLCRAAPCRWWNAPSPLRIGGRGVYDPKLLCLAAVGDLSVKPDGSTGALSSSAEKMDVERLDEDDRKVDLDKLDDEKMVRVCDKLIEIFMVDKPRTTDWRRLLAFSREWSNIRPHFFRRCQERADAEEDPGMKHKLHRLVRKLKEIDEDVQRHNELLEAIKVTPSEISGIVARRRKDFTKEFFEHLHAVAESYYEDPEEQNGKSVAYSHAITNIMLQLEFQLQASCLIIHELCTNMHQRMQGLGNACLAAVQAYDTASENIEALNVAELKFQDIINSPSLDVACKKIDSLAEKKELDSALMLMLTKAWSAAKESNMMKDEVKDILYHLYMTARGNLQRLVPKEIRIVKYLLTIEDPAEQLCALTDAFTPGDEVEGKAVDALCTTPEKLFTWIRTVLDAYHFSREGTVIREARDLMNPNIIQRLEELKKLVQDNFL
ncbi:hypothetical protein Taro_047315 [Colocasia esculenta]|uniref:Uncharacterized protein n=1 Tax=Colocasia esculenta TaxID=4460 RepID=A0A843X0R3_COLES|nr:hypothetical protein [Colocasia esculenta]